MIKSEVVRKIMRLRFIERYEMICIKAFRNGYGHLDYNTNTGKELIKLAREELGYGPTTYAGDIYYLLGRDYRDLLKARKIDGQMQSGIPLKDNLDINLKVEWNRDMTDATIYAINNYSRMRKENPDLFDKLDTITDDLIRKARKVKPPTGLLPKKFHDQFRYESLVEAIERYRLEGKQIPIDWHLEYNQFVERGFIDILKIAQWKIIDHSQTREDQIAAILFHHAPMKREDAKRVADIINRWL